MKLKLDENLEVRLVAELHKEGFDADSVIAEALSGSPDETIYDTCKAVGRTLVTLDLDFSIPLRFPPADSEGIVVVRPPKAVLSSIRATLWSVIAQLKSGGVKEKTVDRRSGPHPRIRSRRCKWSLLNRYPLKGRTSTERPSSSSSSIQVE